MLSHEDHLLNVILFMFNTRSSLKHNISGKMYTPDIVHFQRGRATDKHLTHHSTIERHLYYSLNFSKIFKIRLMGRKLAFRLQRHGKPSISIFMQISLVYRLLEAVWRKTECSKWQCSDASIYGDF